MTITGVKVVNKAGEKQNSLEMAECLNENAYISIKLEEATRILERS